MKQNKNIYMKKTQVEVKYVKRNEKTNEKEANSKTNEQKKTK